MDDTYIKSLSVREKSLQKKKEENVLDLKKRYLDVESHGGELMRLSKEVINEVVQNRISSAEIKIQTGESLIKNIHGDFVNLRKFIAQYLGESMLQLKDLPQLKVDQLEDSFEKAKEEFLEGRILFEFISKGRLYEPTDEYLKDFDTYAGALSDFCGELVRRARSEVVSFGIKTTESIKGYRKITEEIYQILTEYAFSNSSGNRGKIEQLKNFLDSFDKFSYDVKINAAALKERE